MTKTTDTNSQTWYKSNDIKVAIICSALLCFVIIFNLTLIKFLEPDKYSLTFGGELTFSNGTSSLVIDNNNTEPTKQILLYESPRNDSRNLSATHLMDENRKVLNSTNILFDKKPIIILSNNKSVTEINVTTTNIPQGVYHGRILITDNDTNKDTIVLSIPITIATIPLVGHAILWVLAGILISVILLEVTNYLTAKHYELINSEKQQDAIDLIIKKRRNRWSGSDWLGRRYTLLVPLVSRCQ